MMRLLFSGALAQVMFGAACATVGSAVNWTTPAHWTSCNSSYPQAGDTAAIAASTTVTVPAGTYTVGVNGATGTVAITLAASTSTLVVQGTLIVQGGMTVTNGNVQVDGGAELRVSAPDGSTYTVDLAGTSSGGGITFAGTSWTSYGQVNCVRQGTTGLCQINSSGYGLLAGAYGWFSGWGSATLDGAYFFRTPVGGVADLLYTDGGRLRVESTVGTHSLVVSRLDVRNPRYGGLTGNCPNPPATMLLTLRNTVAPSGGAVRQVSGLVVYPSASRTVFYGIEVQMVGATVSDFVVANAIISSNSGSSMTFSNGSHLIAWDKGIDGEFLPRINSGWTYTGNFTLVDYLDGSSCGGPHWFKGGGTDPAIGANTISNSVFLSPGPALDSNRNQGDMVIPAGSPWVADRNVWAFPIGNWCDGLGSGAKVCSGKRNTFARMTDLDNYAAVIFNETSPSATSCGYLTSNLCTDASNCVMHSNTVASGGVRQTTCTMEGNVSWGLTTGNRPWNPATGFQGWLGPSKFSITLSDGSVTSYDTGTCTINGVSGSEVQAGDFIFAGADSIRAGVNVPVVASTATAIVVGTGSNGAVCGSNPLGLSGGSTILASMSYWAGGAYGETSRSAVEHRIDPRFRNNLASALTYDSWCGGPGTTANIVDEMTRVNGWDRSNPPQRVSFKPCYSTAAALRYAREAYRPLNSELAGRGAAGDGSPTPGALDVAGGGILQ